MKQPILEEAVAEGQGMRRNCHVLSCATRAQQGDMYSVAARFFWAFDYIAVVRESFFLLAAVPCYSSLTWNGYRRLSDNDDG